MKVTESILDAAREVAPKSLSNAALQRILEAAFSQIPEAEPVEVSTDVYSEFAKIVGGSSMEYRLATRGGVETVLYSPLSVMTEESDPLTLYVKK